MFSFPIQFYFLIRTLLKALELEFKSFLYYTTRRQTGYCFRRGLAAVFRGQLAKISRCSRRSRTSSPRRHGGGPLADLPQEHQEKRAGQVIIQIPASLILAQRFLRRGAENGCPPSHSRWRPSYIFAHPLSLRHLLSFKPRILNCHFPLFSLSPPSARCHCLGSRLLLHIFYLTSLLFPLSTTIRPLWLPLS